MLKFKRSHTASQASDFSIAPPRLGQRKPSEPSLQRKCSFVTSQLGYSKASVNLTFLIIYNLFFSVVLRNLCLPLAWPVEEYFGNKKEWREFTVQLVLRSSEGREVFSKPMERINRTYTDVDFPDTFVFPDQGPEFCVELLVYCRRTDENSQPGVVHSLSRSLGRSIGQSLKRYMRPASDTVGGSGMGGGAPNRHFLEELQGRSNKGTISGSFANGGGLSDVPGDQLEEYLENWRNPEKMCIIGSARFRLKNATLTGRTHTYNLERIPNERTNPNIGPQQLLPIYGNICAQLLVQPTSLGAPLAQGTLDVFFVEGGLLLQRLFCVLQGGWLKCYDGEDSGSQRQLSEKNPARAPALTLPINGSTVIENTAFQTALRLKLTSPEEQKPRHFLCISDTQSSFIGWRNALNMQIVDCSIWSDFALAQRNPHAASLDLNTDTNLYLSPYPSPRPKTGDRVFQIPRHEALTSRDDEMEQRPRANSSASMFLGPKAFDKSAIETKYQGKSGQRPRTQYVPNERDSGILPFTAKTTAIPRPSFDPRFLATASLPGNKSGRKTVSDLFEQTQTTIFPPEVAYPSEGPIPEANEDEFPEEPQTIKIPIQLRDKKPDHIRDQASKLVIHQDPVNYVTSLKIGDSPTRSLFNGGLSGITNPMLSSSTRRSSTAFSNSTTTSASSTGAKTRVASFALNAFPNIIPVNPSTSGSSNGINDTGHGFGSESPRIYQFEALRNYNMPISSRRLIDAKSKPIGNGTVATGQGRPPIGRVETWHFARRTDENHNYQHCTRL